MLKEYYRLTKPGIIYGNLMTAVAGYLLGSGGHVDPKSLIAMAVGTSLVIASACVFNNYIDQDIDALMARTRKRALVLGDISEENALFFASTLGIVGIFILVKLTNTPTVMLGVIGFLSYVMLYTKLKRRTVHGTLIGTISGATPIAAGYTAATGRFDLGALLLFVTMAIWQMPHFYAIAMFRRDDYKAAGIPVLSVVKGMHASKIQILLYVIAYIIAAGALALYGYASFTYFVVITWFGAFWLWKAIKGLRKGTDDVRWARGMFGTSLLVLLVFSIMLSLDAWLP